MEAIYFGSADEFRAWLDEHHDIEDEVIVGFYKVATGKPSMTWSESVDQALCYGWIDGVRRGVDDERYTMRFSRRRPNSTWSKINVAKVADLTARGLMRPAGLAAFERRTDERTGTYSFESETAGLGDEYEAALRADTKAWAFWQSQPPGYRKTAAHWVTSAKKEETRQRRLATLIDDSRAGRRIGPLRRD